MSYNIEQIRADFPILKVQVNGKPLVYFDNGATTQKPQQVIDAVSKFYAEQNANIHRGVHYLSGLATELYEDARCTVQKYINAKHSHEVIFTNGTTFSLNLLATSFGEAFINEGDEIIVSIMEHHANFVPWQLLAEKKGAKLKVIPLTDEYQLDFEAYKKLFTDKTKIVSITHVSNSLGTINPVKKFIDYAHERNVPVAIDAAQSIQHEKVDVQELDCDFLVFSGHKIYAETGIGIFYGKEQWLEKMPPYQSGGDMIKHVTIEKTEFADLPFKFEAGTTNYVGAYSLKVAIDYINSVGLDNINAYEHELYEYALGRMREIDDIEIYTTSQKNRISVISFNLMGAHNFDVGTLLDKFGVAVRTGKHCTHPLMQAIGIDGTVRASFAMYSTKEEVDIFIEALKKTQMMLG